MPYKRGHGRARSRHYKASSGSRAITANSSRDMALWPSLSRRS
uniref:Uncharacterized protein n=1 Tax=Arundo donax TaxID=35708 RepID=A0A0A9AQ99_ARUDO